MSMTRYRFNMSAYFKILDVVADAIAHSAAFNIVYASIGAIVTAYNTDWFDEVFKMIILINLFTIVMSDFISKRTLKKHNIESKYM